MKTKTIYIAFDGTTFDDELDCLDYEKKNSFKQLSSNCTFLDRKGEPRSHEEFRENPGSIFGMYIPSLEDAEIVRDICIEVGASSPWDYETFESTGFFWYCGGWENVDEMIKYWTEIKTNLLPKGVN